MKLINVCAANAENNACLCGKFAHLFIVGCICTIQDRFACFAYFQSSFCSVCVLTAKYQNFSGCGCFRYKRYVFVYAISGIVYIQHLCAHTLTDTVVINFFVFFQFCIDLFVRHAATERYRITGFAYKCFLMTIEDRLSAKSVLTVAGSDFDRLHWRCGSFGKLCHSVVRHIWAG